MRVDDNLEIKQFAEKPKDPAVIDSLAISPALAARLTTPSTEKRCLASMGIYVFSRDVLQDALDNQMTDFGKEVIPSLLGKQAPLRLHLRGLLGGHRDGARPSSRPTSRWRSRCRRSISTRTPRRSTPTPASCRPPRSTTARIDHVVVGDGSIITDTDAQALRHRHPLHGARGLAPRGRGDDGRRLLRERGGGEGERRPGPPQRRRGVRNCRIRGAIIDKNARIGDGMRALARRQAQRRLSARRHDPRRRARRAQGRGDSARHERFDAGRPACQRLRQSRNANPCHKPVLPDGTPP